MESTTASRSIQKACVWAGPLMGLMFVVGFVTAGFFPPPSPDMTAPEVAAMIEQNRTAIRIGVVICLASCPLLMPFLASFTIQMRRIEGLRPIMAYTQLALGALATIEFVIPYVFMLVSTYRADQNPDVTRALYDLSWFFFLGVISTFVLQLLLFGVAVLVDARADPVFPRWLGYANIWLALTFTPASFLVFFKTGPLAWNGVFVWWVPVFAFLLWFVPNFVYLLRAIDRDDRLPCSPHDNLEQEVAALKARLDRIEPLAACDRPHAR
ncbi:hypothetical protein EV580_4718 [Mycobacterium sp. BK086]|uniref:hypothetical protein n=1 Tax=Mycobacterium sp. BK086 TaxID=2512165 RepID=UPI00106081A9|nr:hypothetical protein [Mycobacterium sp. BK086]TDO10430.1 hypothetical protein EV580_4718 [Mycobacterium sp. BK086]